MKANAIFRIVLWSIVIVLLVGILLWSTGIGRFRIQDEELLTTMYTVQLTESPSVEPQDSCTVLETVNVRTSPSLMSKTAGMLEAGTTVTVEKTQNISDQTWAYVTQPVQGWVAAEFLQAQSPQAEEHPAAEPSVKEGSRAVLEPVNVHSSPSQDAQILAMLVQGDSANVTVTETVNGVLWGYITEPVSGWVEMACIEGGDVAPKAPPLPAGPGFGYSGKADTLREIDVEWALGEITIQTADVEKVHVQETNLSEGKVGDMVLKREEDKLSIRFSDKKHLSIGETMTKDLTILLPREFVLDSLEVEAASATLLVKDMTIREMDFEGASGICNFENCTIQALDLETASGDILFQGTVGSLECEAASANVYAVLENVPGRIQMESMSGSLDITLPENAGFTASLKGMSTEFVSDFDYTQTGKTYTCADGACKITMNAMSGDVYVRKAG